jgi:hypothetical protein
MKTSRFHFLALCGMSMVFMAPTDGEASTAPNAPIDQAKLDSDTSAVVAAESNLAAAQATLSADQTEFATEQAEVAAEQTAVVAHPVLGVLDEIESLVAAVSPGIVDDFKGMVVNLIEKARDLVDAPLESVTPAVVAPVDMASAPTA